MARAASWSELRLLGTLHWKRIIEICDHLGPRSISKAPRCSKQMTPSYWSRLIVTNMACVTDTRKWTVLQFRVLRVFYVYINLELLTQKKGCLSFPVTDEEPVAGSPKRFECQWGKSRNYLDMHLLKNSSRQRQTMPRHAMVQRTIKKVENRQNKDSQCRHWVNYGQNQRSEKRATTRWRKTKHE